MSSRYFRRTFESSSGRWVLKGPRLSLRTPDEGSVGPDRERICSARAAGPGGVIRRHGPDGVHQASDFAFHALKPRLQIEDDLDTCEIDPEVARERQDDFQALDGLLVVQTRVPRRARGPYEALALVEPERLRMDP